MAISIRLKTIADLVTPGYRAADIGTDHGYVPIYLLRQKIAPFVIAADLSPGSLQKAKENAERAGFTDPSVIDFRLSDGLSMIRPGEVDAIILSGMGGILMDRILRNGREVMQSAKELILSPHRDVQLLRELAEEYGFVTEADLIVKDRKKEYPVLKLRVPPSGLL